MATWAGAHESMLLHEQLDALEQRLAALTARVIALETAQAAANAVRSTPAPQPQDEPIKPSRKK